MSEVNIGTVYDCAKGIAANAKPLTNEEFECALANIRRFLFAKNNKYYMLLNREKYDFTLFNLGDKNGIKMNKIVYEDLKECIQNRGNIIVAGPTEDYEAYEIWINIGEDAFLYYLLPYDLGVIE